VGFGVSAPPGGYHNSLEYDLNGVPHIAYITAGGGLYHAAKTTGDGNCGDPGGWQCDLVDASGILVGTYASLDLTLTGWPRISYSGPLGVLKYAAYVGSGGNCGPGNSWRCDVIDSSVIVAGTSLHVAKCLIQPCGISTQIAYFDAANGLLKHARYVGGNAGNCGFGSQLDDWQCETIEMVGDADPMSVSLAVRSGRQLIAYQDADDQDHPILKVAEALEMGDIGNCGPANPFATWQCAVVDDGGNWGEVGKYAALALNSAGLAYIAYHDENYHTLKVAYEHLEVFVPIVIAP
jgi:hypothetical protein